MFNNPSSPKINALARGIGEIACFIILLVGTSFISMMFAGKSFTGFSYGMVGTICALLAVFIFIKIDGTTFKAIGLYWERQTLGRFAIGLIIGIAIFMFIFLTIAVSCGLDFKMNSNINWRAIGTISLALIPLAVMEEIAFRSYPLIKLDKAYGVWPTQLIIALAFGIYHVFNGWGFYLSFTGPFVWAFVFGLAALWSKGIAMPTGIHLALNIMQNIGGFKNNDTAIFQLVSRGVETKESIALQSNVGLGLHVVVLVISLAATHWYNKRQ